MQSTFSRYIAWCLLLLLLLLHLTLHSCLKWDMRGVGLEALGSVKPFKKGGLIVNTLYETAIVIIICVATIFMYPSLDVFIIYDSNLFTLCYSFDIPKKIKKIYFCWDMQIIPIPSKVALRWFIFDWWIKNKTCLQLLQYKKIFEYEVFRVLIYTTYWTYCIKFYKK